MTSLFAYSSFVMSFILVCFETYKILKYKNLYPRFFFYMFNFLFLNLWLLNFNYFIAKDSNLSYETINVIFVFNLSLLIGHLLFSYRVISFKSITLSEFSKDQIFSLKLFFYTCIFFSFIYYLQNGLYIFEFSNNLRLETRDKTSGYITVFLSRGFNVVSSILGICLAKNLIKSKHIMLCLMIILTMQLASGFISFASISLIVFAMSYSFFTKNISFRNIILTGIGIISIFILLSVLTNRVSSTNSIYDFFEHRFLLELPRVLGQTIEYSKEYGFQYGKTYLIDLATIMPGNQLGFSQIITLNTYYNISIIFPLTISLPGELYINFGFLGVALIALIYQIIFRNLEILLSKKKSVIAYGFLVYLGFLIANSLTLGIGASIVTRFIPLLVMYYIFLFFMSFYREKT